MDYILKPSLEHMTLVKIAVELWNQDDIRALIAKFHFPLLGSDIREKRHKKIEDKVIEKVPQLQLPKLLKEKILGFVRPVGLQILKWLEYHNINNNLVKSLPSKLCWTPQGTVDKKKTAEMLIKDENLNITNHYRLACMYCLEDDIRALWSQMPENKQGAFYRGEKPSFTGELELVVFWTYDIKGEVAKLDNIVRGRTEQSYPPYQYAFQCAAVGSNEAATKYFLQKLTPEEKEKVLVKYAGRVVNRRCDSVHSRGFPKEFYTDVLCFLLSTMNKEQRVEVFKSYPYRVLKCLLVWPWQSCFMENAECMWDFLSEEDYYYLLVEITDKVKDGYKDYNYQELFEEFWQQSPTHCKKYVIDECASGFLLRALFKIEDEKSIKLILRDATAAERKKIISCSRGQDICESLIYNDKWDLLKFFIEECISSKETIKFKEEFKERMTHRRSKEQLEIEKDMWNKFFSISR